MIRPLTENDRDSCMKFVKEKPAENLFIIGDIEAYGFDHDIQEVWGEFNQNGQYKAVLLRYRDNYIIYAPNDFDVRGIANIIDQDERKNKFVSGIGPIVNQVVDHLTYKPNKRREFYYAKCESLQKQAISKEEIKQASVHDIPRIINLHEQIPEFETREGREESLKQNMEQGVSRIYYIEDGGDIVSTAMTTAENTFSAMIIGVCTLEGYKKKGYASACMTHLCEKLLSEGKHLCLFYDNPEAGNIYKRLGFEDIGKWVMNIY
ncbi:GNAT family N-acetyltransferase [Salinibacillus xinjiangensis]|uniref:GNAT family N-acetyltransferase n=1 Tax=Salinibacillus xinjiangensis TaxID=1229268 RepID=A0A6G1X5A4_9BACI|nr:GNAT family N-acetyltransferase [Salinibacillus xinjiangensis]MRG86122.1 GNAT family N-acetyltransferase [Salinibacillus xinjiangensis]